MTNTHHLHDTGLIFETHLEHFDRDVIQASHEVPILVDFWADWCPPCRALTPVLERVIAHLAGKVRMATVEVDEGHNMKLAYITGLPDASTIFFISALTSATTSAGTGM